MRESRYVIIIINRRPMYNTLSLCYAIGIRSAAETAYVSFT